MVASWNAFYLGILSRGNAQLHLSPQTLQEARLPILLSTKAPHRGGGGAGGRKDPQFFLAKNHPPARPHPRGGLFLLRSTDRSIFSPNSLDTAGSIPTAKDYTGRRMPQMNDLITIDNTQFTAKMLDGTGMNALYFHLYMGE